MIFRVGKLYRLLRELYISMGTESIPAGSILMCIEISEFGKASIKKRIKIYKFLGPRGERIEFSRLSNCDYPVDYFEEILL